MNTKHTQGPWTMKASTILANDGINPIAIVNPAAPELLEALKIAMDELIASPKHTTPAIMNQIFEAIKKAEGGAK